MAWHETHQVWPSRLPSSSCRAKSQILSVWSSEAETNLASEGAKDTEVTSPEWALEWVGLCGVFKGGGEWVFEGCVCLFCVLGGGLRGAISADA